MGSKDIYKAYYQSGWVFIGIIGKKECYEKLATNNHTTVSVTKVFKFNPGLPTDQVTFKLPGEVEEPVQVKQVIEKPVIDNTK